jgi:dTMP kinase
MNAPRGRFLTFEGIDGAGKTTHVQWLAELLRIQGKEVVVTREPGGTPVGEALRAVLLEQPMQVETEALLMFAARSESLKTVIEPALRAGRWVISDRFTDASFAYQGGGKGLASSKLEALAEWVHPAFAPDLTLFFDVSPAMAAARLSGSRVKDRFEKENEAFFERVRCAYRERAQATPKRIRIIDGMASITDIRKHLEEIILSI